MEICSSGHGAVCFDDGYAHHDACPACTANEERDEKQKEIDVLQEKIETLETQLENAEAAS